MKHEPPALLAQFMKAAPGISPTGEYLMQCFGAFDFDGITPKLRTTTFSGRMTRKIGDKTAELIEVGPAHTGGDTLVHVPADCTVFTGDILFVEGTPIMWAGPVGNWIAACDTILTLDCETIVPGHGPVTDKRGVEAVRNYLTYHPRSSPQALRRRPLRARRLPRHRPRRLRLLGRRRAHRRQRRDALPRIRGRHDPVQSHGAVHPDGRDLEQSARLENEGSARRSNRRPVRILDQRIKSESKLRNLLMFGAPSIANTHYRTSTWSRFSHVFFAVPANGAEEGESSESCFQCSSTNQA